MNLANSGTSEGVRKAWLIRKGATEGALGASDEADSMSAQANRSGLKRDHLDAAASHKAAEKGHLEAADVNASDKPLREHHIEAASKHNEKKLFHEKKAESAKLIANENPARRRDQFLVNVKRRQKNGLTYNSCRLFHSV